jgi:hypothetical protein
MDADRRFQNTSTPASSCWPKNVRRAEAEGRIDVLFGVLFWYGFHRRL